MAIPSHTKVFALAMFAIALITSVYTALFHSLPLLQWLVSGLLAGVLLSIFGGYFYQIGVKVSGASPTRNRAISNALFAYFYAYAISQLFNLFSVSWFIFGGLVYLASFLSGWRLSRVKTEVPLTHHSSGTPDGAP